VKRNGFILLSKNQVTAN